MNRQLHPTLKKCKCGHVATRAGLYKHFDAIKFIEGRLDMSRHGEVLLHTDDPVLLNNSNIL